VWSKDIAQKHQDFIFKILRGAYKIGEYWSRIKNYKERGVCKICDVVELMEHILFECKANSNNIIWGKAKEFFSQKTG
jgi:hypothetical protein